MRWAFAVLVAFIVSVGVWLVARMPYHQDLDVTATLAVAAFPVMLGLMTRRARRDAEPDRPDTATTNPPAGVPPTTTDPVRAVEMRQPADDLQAGRSADRAAMGGQVVVGAVPGEAVAWQDRDVLLDRLTVTAGTGRTVVVCALAGQRGIGKTQLAAAYARLRHAQGWPVVAWVVADTPASLVNGLDALATAAGVRQPDTDSAEVARAALGWLRTQPGPCLLVYDNAVDPDLIRAWTPPVGAVHTVVTTTNRAFDTVGVLLDVGLFTPAEAVAYLHTRTGLGGDEAVAAEVAEQLGRLPLALACAGAVIGAHRRYRSYRAYLDRLAAVAVEEALAHPGGDPYPRGAAEAVLLGLDDLAAADRDGHARRLLDRLAVLAPTGADSGLLAHLSDDDSAAALLAERSLTTPTDDTDRLVVHRLVQRVTREQRQHAGQLAALLVDTATRLRAAADELGDRWDTRTCIGEYAQHAEALAAHPADQPTQRALLHLRQRMQYWLGQVHNYSAAITVGAAVVADRQRVLGPDHPDTLTSRSNLATGYRAVGRFDEAIALDEQTLVDQQRVLGADHPDTLGSRNNLAISYGEVGRFDEAIALDEQTLADRQRVLGPDHPDTLASRNNLAISYREVGRFDEAIALHERTLADRQRVLRADHPDTLRSRNNLAYSYRAVGRLDEAIALNEQTLADLQRVLGADHPDTLASRSNLANSYHTVGRLDEAITLHEQNLADRQRVLGPDHPETLTSRNNLAAAVAEREQNESEDDRVQQQNTAAEGAEPDPPSPGQLA